MGLGGWQCFLDGACNHLRGVVGVLGLEFTFHGVLKESLERMGAE